MKTDRSERPDVSNVVRRDEINVVSVHVQGHQFSGQGCQFSGCATNVNAEV